MNDVYQRIILVTDALQSSRAATETAFSLAKRHNAKVTIVDTLKPPSTASRWISSNSSDVFEMVLADKQERLEKIASRFREVGIDAESKVLFGKSSEAITLEAIQSDADLVVRYMKGVRSKFPGLFGNTARSLMRICPCPILLVGESPIENPRVVACINAEHEQPENFSISMESAHLAGDHKNLLGLYCWNIYGSEMLQHHMDETSYENTIKHGEKIYRTIYEKYCEEHDVSAFENGIRFEYGDPAEVIPKFCRDEKIDVVVMSSASLNHPVRRLLGSTVESVLEQLPCALMVVKPIGFKSPLKTDGANATVTA